MCVEVECIGVCVCCVEYDVWYGVEFVDGCCCVGGVVVIELLCGVEFCGIVCVDVGVWV